MGRWHPGKHRNLLLALCTAQIAALVAFIGAAALPPTDSGAAVLELCIGAAISLLVVGMIWRHFAQAHAQDIQSARDGVAAQNAEKLRRAEADTIVKAHQQDLARHSAAQARLVRVFSDGLSRLANGDLTTRIESPRHDPFPKEHEPLMHAYNAALQQLDAIFRQIQAHADSVADTSNDLNLAIRDLSSRAGAHTTRLEHAATELNQLANTLQTAAETVATTVNQTQTGLKKALSGAEAIEQALDATSPPSQLVGIIDDIAVQAHLLALNTSADQGLAFVTSKLRALAERATTSAQKLREQPLPESHMAQSGVSPVCTARATIREGCDLARATSESIARIANSTCEHAVQIQDMGAEVTALVQTTRHDSDTATRATQMALTLSEQALSIAASTRQFRLRNTAEAVQPKSMCPTPEPFISARSAERMAVEQHLSERQQNGQLWTNS